MSDAIRTVIRWIRQRRCVHTSMSTEEIQEAFRLLRPDNRAEDRLAYTYTCKKCQKDTYLKVRDYLPVMTSGTQAEALVDETWTGEGSRDE